jgi:hypothetical protein
MATFFDTPLVVIGSGFRAKHHRFLAVLGHRENRVGLGEIDDAEGVRVWNVGPWRPFRHQFRRPDLVIVVAEKADVDIEVLDELREHPLTHPSGGSRVRRHQFGSDGGDDKI